MLNNEFVVGVVDAVDSVVAGFAFENNDPEAAAVVGVPLDAGVLPTLPNRPEPVLGAVEF